jgi:hypothetical protein
LFYRRNISASSNLRHGDRYEHFSGSFETFFALHQQKGLAILTEKWGTFRYKNAPFVPFYTTNEHFTKTGSGQT